MFFVNTLHLSVSKLKKKTFKLNEQQMSFFNDCLKNICEETNFLKLLCFEPITYILPLHLLSYYSHMLD